METREKRRFDWAGATIAVSAACMVALFAYRELSPRSPRAARSGWTQIENWEAITANRPRIGPANARVEIVEFVDYECPACYSYARELDSILARYPRDVALLVAHTPLSYHRFAQLAARSADCAYGRNAFPQMHRLLFAKQDSIGLKSWGSFALEAGVRDTSEFAACVRATTPLASLARDTVLADELGLRGTPSIAINGVLHNGTPTLTQLDSIVRSVIGGVRAGQ